MFRCYGNICAPCLVQVTDVIGTWLLQLMDGAAFGGLLGENHSWVRSTDPIETMSSPIHACALLYIQGGSVGRMMCTE